MSETKQANAVTTDECIIFTGFRQRGGTGYGERTVEGVRWLAHRYAYFQANGPIPAGMMVCHSCDNKGCINPKHLHLGTASTNLKEAWDRGLAGNQNTAKTKCPKCGSAFVYSAITGERRCRKCHLDWERKNRHPSHRKPKKHTAAAPRGEGEK